jgi:DNA-binding winged helix-turn-helix (wHTH) protein/tetratricopeptide (TPR) repeat protein
MEIPTPTGGEADDRRPRPPGSASLVLSSLVTKRVDVMALSHWLFGPFRLDPDNACLWHGAQARPLTPKAFSLLHYLVTHADRLITKDELFEALWTDIAVSEAALRVCIGELRHTLGEAARAPQFIATVTRRGYRFLAPVTRQDPSAVADSDAMSQRSRAPVAAAGLLVGREAVLDRLHAAWEQACQGVRQVCLVAGEAGIGKTAVVETFAAQVTTEPTVWLAQGQCVEHYGTREAYLPVLEALGQLVRAPRGARLVALLRQQAPTRLVQMPWVLTDTDRVQFQHELQGATRERMLRELAEVVETLTAETPLVMVLEDLHWSDYATLDLVALLARRRAPARLLLLGTYRPAEVIVHAHPLRLVAQTLHQYAHCQELWLESLTVDEVAAYLHGRFGRSRVLAALAHALHQRTEGHPLFLRNVVEALVRQGAVVQVGEAWDLPGGGAAIALDVPDSLRHLIEQQAEQLSAAAQQVLEAASVAGMACTVAAVAAALDVEESAVDDVCATLARQGLFLGTSGQERWPDGTLTACYHFLHSLYRDVLYHRTPLGRRQRLHQRIGAREEAGYGARAGERAAVLAEHFARGGDARRAVHYLRQAGDNDLARSAYREAVACYEHALKTVQQLPESRDTREQAIDLRLALRNVLWTLGELGRLFVTLQEAVDLAEALGDPHRLGWVSAYLLAHFAQVGDPDRALAAGQRALALATTLGEMDLTVVAQHYLGGVYRSLGDYRRAVECFQTNVASLPSALGQEHLGLPGMAAVFARSHLVVALAECGAFAEGRALAEEGVQMAEAAQHPYSRVMAWWAAGFRALRQGDLPQTLRVLERALALVQESDLRLLVPMVAAPLGAAYAIAGRTADAVPLLEQAVAQAVARQYLWDHALRVVWLGEAYLCAGRLDEAGAQAQQALEFAQAHQERGHAAYALWLLGEGAAQRASPESAQTAAYYQQALALTEELGMRPLQAHCHLGLSTLYAATDQRERARAALSAAITLYRQMEMTFWLPQAEAVLAQVEGQ